jgi:signal transduction histidine kinase
MLQNLPIRSKLVAILLVPLLSLVSVAALRMAVDLSAGRRADRAVRSVRAVVRLTALVHELQEEQARSAAYLGTSKTTGAKELAVQRAETDTAIAIFRADLESFDGGDNQELARRLDVAGDRLDGLEADRQLVDNAPTTVERTIAAYSETTGALTATAGQVLGVDAGDGLLVRRVVAFAAVGQMKEFASQERALLGGITARGRFLGGQYEAYTALLTTEQVWAGLFASFASPDQADLLRATVSGPNVDKAEQFTATAVAGENAPRLGIEAAAWFEAMDGKIDLLRRAEVALGDDVLRAATADAAEANHRALIVGLALLGVVTLALVVSMLIGRSMVEPMHRLRQAAHDIATRKLPRAVARLQQADPNAGPVDFEAEVRPIQTRARDEVGQVAEAFNTVHRVAVQVAAEQSILRRSVGDLFLNMARRSQSLIDRQLELIDELERGETDPAALEELFRLDHLATRMRRNAEDLIVLSGAEPSRRWSDPVVLTDAVRAAIAEVEDYTRVELIPMDDVALIGRAVNDVVHLFAELIENATSFSPPGTKVLVSAQSVNGAHLVEIEDRGIGMTETELMEANERLADPADGDYSLGRRLGFYVVARLAQRHDIKVQLRPSWYGGVRALVLLPPNLIVQLGEPEGYGQEPLSLMPPDPRPEPQPAGARRTHEKLPIFEAARSDWFDSGQAQALHHPPVQHRAYSDRNDPPRDQQTDKPQEFRFAARGTRAPGHTAPGGASRNGHGANGRNGNGATAYREGPGTPPPRRRDSGRLAPSPPPNGTGPVVGDPAPFPPFPPSPTARAGTTGSGLPRRAPTAPREDDLSGPVPPLRPATTTRSGLPRRVPRANLAPGIARQADPPPPTDGEAPGERSPNAVRDTLSRYRSGLERGRSAVSAGEAATMPAPDPGRAPAAGRAEGSGPMWEGPEGPFGQQQPGTGNGHGPYREGLDGLW